MSRTAQTAEKKSKRQRGADPDPVAICKSPAKEVKRLLQAYPGLKSQTGCNSVVTHATRRKKRFVEREFQLRRQPTDHRRKNFTRNSGEDSNVGGSSISSGGEQRKQISDTRGPTDGIEFTRRK